MFAHWNAIDEGKRILHQTSAKNGFLCLKNVVRDVWLSRLLRDVPSAGRQISGI